MKLALAIVVLTSGCAIKDLDLTGKQCPCPAGYACTQPSNTCVRESAGAPDAPPTDSNDDIDAPGIDAPLGVSCLTSPLAHMAYTTSFGDFAQTWAPVGGLWMADASGLHQTSSLATLAYASHSIPSTMGSSDYRIVAEMKQTGQNNNQGGALEIAFRIDTQKQNMYHCNLEPNDGLFMIQETDNGLGGPTLIQVQLQGLDPLATYVMEVQAIGAKLECCVRGIPGAHLMRDNQMYLTGDAVGLKTYLMSGAFRTFAVFN